MFADDCCLDVIKKFEVIFDRSDLSDHRPIKCTMDLSNIAKSNVAQSLAKKNFIVFRGITKNFVPSIWNKLESILLNLAIITFTLSLIKLLLSKRSIN